MKLIRKIGISVLLVVLVISSVFGAVYYSDIGEFLRLSRTDATYGGGVMMSASSSQFQVNGCGEDTVLDKVINICWERNWSSSGTLNWTDALAYCDELTLAGRTDWSLPNIKEYRRLIPEGAAYDADEGELLEVKEYIEDLGFHDVVENQNSYWSKTEAKITSNSPPDHAWYVRLENGNDDYASQSLDGRRAVCSVWND